MSLLSDNAHTLINLGMATPIHAATTFSKDSMGKRGIRPVAGPLGAYFSYRAGRQMDKGELTEGDAIMNAGFLANSIASLAEPALSNKGPTYSILEKIYGKNKHIPENVLKNTFLTAGTIGLGLPLYFYYRQGLKKQQEEQANRYPQVMGQQEEQVHDYRP